MESTGLWCRRPLPTDEFALTGSEEGIAHLWDVAAGELLLQLTGHSGAVTAVDFSPDGETLLTASADGMVRLWEAGSGRLIASLMSLPEDQWVVVGPDGQFDVSDLRLDLPLGWVWSDEPMRPISLSTMTEQYFEPRLLGRLWARREPDRAVPNLTTLSRSLPLTRVTVESVGPEGMSLVRVTVSSVSSSVMVLTIPSTRSRRTLAWQGEASVLAHAPAGPQKTVAGVRPRRR